MSINIYQNPVKITDTTISSTINTGALIVYGGISVSNNITVGNKILLFNGSKYTGLIASNSSNNNSFSLPSTFPTTNNQFLTSDTTGNLSFSYITPNYFTFTGSQNITNGNITGLTFTSGFFEVNITASVNATTNLVQLFKLFGVVSGTGSWNINVIEPVGDQTGITFNITSGGQVQYSSPNYSGFTSLTFSWVNMV
jgi:hypothetical protein